MRVWALLCVVGSTGCLRQTQFVCDNDTACGPQGRCEPVGFCSYPDTGCTGTMRRFGDTAGALASTCVGADGGIDAGVDTPTADVPPGHCPDYTTLTGGTSGHRYKLLPSAESWDTQVAACAAPGYLGIPDDVAELTAMAERNGSNKIWLGINDKLTDGTFVNVKDVLQMYLPWKPGHPKPPENNEDCVAWDSSTEIIDEACNSKFEAVCECED